MNPEIHPRMMAKLIALSRARPTMTDQELEDGSRLAAKSGMRHLDGLIKVRDLGQPARARPLPPPYSTNGEYRQREAHEKTGSVPNGTSVTTGAGGDWPKSEMRALSLSRILLAGLSLALLQPLRAAPGQVTFTLSAGTVGAFDFDVVTLAVTQPDAPNSFTDAVVTGKFARESDAPFNKLDGFCDATCGSVFCVRLMPKAAGHHSFSGRYREADFERAREATGMMGSSPLSISCEQCGHVSRRTLEDIAAGLALGKRFNALHGHATNGREVLAAAASDSVAATIVQSAGEALESQAALLINMLDPEVVGIGGGLGLSDGPYWDHFIASSRRHVWSELHRDLPILQAATGVNAGWIGAAAKGWREFPNGSNQPQTLESKP
jgi:glucokinase